LSQENRTPDNLFPDAKLIAAGSDIQNFDVNSKGTQMTLTPAPLASDFNPDHSHSSIDVSWVIPSGATSDHAGINDGSDPPGWPRW
jgi:hypothetical protein